MTVVATTLSGGLISHPTGISGTIYFSDGAPDGGWNIRSYYPIVLDDLIYPVNIGNCIGMNPVFNGTKLALVASVPDYLSVPRLYFYDPVLDSWTSGTPSGVVPISLMMPYVVSVSGDTTCVFASMYDESRWNVYLYDSASGDLLDAWTQITTNDTEIPSGWDVVDINLATSRGVGSAGEMYMYLNNGGTASSSIKMFTLPVSSPFSSGTWTDVTPDYLSSGTAIGITLLLYPPPATHVGLGIVTTVGTGTDDVFARFWDTTGLLSNNVVMLRHISGTDWVDTGFVPITTTVETTDGNVAVFGEVDGKLMYGFSLSQTDICTYTSSATSSWTNTNFPTTPANMAVYGIGVTAGVSSALYLPTTLNFTSSHLSELHFSTSGSETSSYIVINAVSGDIYNIGGVSNEPTTHIVFTMWDNAAYGSKGKGK